MSDLEEFKGALQHVWSAVMQLYLAGEHHQSALEKLAQSAPNSIHDDVKKSLEESKQALHSAFTHFRIKAEPPEGEG